MAKLIRAGNGFGNELLDRLSRKDGKRLEKHLRHVALARGQVLYGEGDRVDYVYFPDDCLISLIAMTEDAQTLEVGVTGTKGAMGLPAIFRTGVMPYRSVVQIPGTAWRIKAKALREEFDQAVKLRNLFLRYFHTLLTQVTQSAVCHRFHKILPRMSRWLLDCQYHTGKDTLNLTHEVLAGMLGTSRALITTTASQLQRAGTISRRQGSVTILDHKLLESFSCECHKIVRRDFADSLGF